ncbi:MAG: tRNA pseudouridine(55) synthase TruB [Synergistaceae bacterium]|nr:tRNA pseudouridine(55) synthase TruB [Synergistaceae bacterium]
MPNGILLIDKPEGMRSADCVNRVKRAFGKGTRVGHSGTLDSTASGLLVLLLGTATRLSDAVMVLPKTYRAAVKLGRATDTCDASGQTVFEGDSSGVDDEALRRVLLSFLGWRMQRPPKISAVKLDGSPAHRLARAGQDIDLAPRPVFIRSLFASPMKDGQVELVVGCGKGTYIRALARDLGEKLGCGAYVESLRRLSIGPFRVEDAASPDALEQDPSPRFVRPLWGVPSAFHHIELTDEAEGALSHGSAVPMSGAGEVVPGMVAFSSGVCVVGKGTLGFAERVEREGAPFLKPRVNISDVAEASAS